MITDSAGIAESYMTPDHIQPYHMRIVHFNAVIKINNIAVCRV